jgi:hypothetical protein
MLYDQNGTRYNDARRTEPRIARRIWAALGNAQTVLNVGAGTGSYEPPNRDVTAVEPSAVMRAQRGAGAARCIAAPAEALPFGDRSFDARLRAPERDLRVARGSRYGRQGGVGGDDQITTALRGVSERVPTLSRRARASFDPAA